MKSLVEFPSLILNYPFFLLSSTLRFSFAALCTTNFSQSFLYKMCRDKQRDNVLAATIHDGGYRDAGN